jgi:alkane 1-monooxygenase
MELVGMTLTMGVSCGVLGINVAHELGHRSRKAEQFMAKLLLLSSLYMHFFIEHNRGHHKNVSTEEDPASAPYGMALYPFIVRSVVRGWLGAWKLEARRLEREGRPVWSLRNEMLRFQLIQFGSCAAVLLAFGWKGLTGFVLAAILGWILLEVVNYIEHYGLRRRKKENGHYERVLPGHSWNSDHPVGRLLLFELTRHSDHHYLASRPYQVLRHFDESPQLPAGYPAMMILATIPPLWFRVMNPRVRALQAA